MKRTISALAALIVLGVALPAMAENDTDRSTRDAKSFYEKLDAERGN